jgi:hypothetical protein
MPFLFLVISISLAFVGCHIAPASGDNRLAQEPEHTGDQQEHAERSLILKTKTQIGVLAAQGEALEAVKLPSKPVSTQ